MLTFSNDSMSSKPAVREEHERFCSLICDMEKERLAISISITKSYPSRGGVIVYLPFKFSVFLP